MYKYFLLLLINVAFCANLQPATHTTIEQVEGHSLYSRVGRWTEDGHGGSIMDGHGGLIIRMDQYYTGTRIDGFHSTEHVVNGDVVDVTGWVVTEIEDDLPSVSDIPLVDIDLLVEPWNCDEVKHEVVIQIHHDVAIMAYVVDCWSPALSDGLDCSNSICHRIRMDFDAATGELLNMYDSTNFYLPKAETHPGRRKLPEQSWDEAEFVPTEALSHGCDSIIADQISMISEGTVLRIVDCTKSSEMWRFEFEARTGELLNHYKQKARRNLKSSSIPGHGGNQRTGQLTHFMKIQHDGDTCTYSNDFMNVVHNEFTYSRHRTTPYSFPCNDLAEQTDTINGAYSPLNDAIAYGQVVFNMFMEWYQMAPFGELSMRVHFGNSWENAMWDGSAMYFGDGQSNFHPLVSLGVIAHGVSHGVTDHLSKLIYQDQPGGINEALSDMSAAAAEYYYYGETSYEMGSKVAKGEGAVRFMCDPTLDGHSIDHIDDYTSGMDVHFSSGVFNKVFCELSKLDNWDPRKTFNLFLTCNRAYWKKDSQFQEAADLAISAATALAYETEDVCNAFAVVGITPQGCNSDLNPEPVCQGLRTSVQLHTRVYATEMSWFIEGAQCDSLGAQRLLAIRGESTTSSGLIASFYEDHAVYEQTCCIPPGDYVLNCVDSYGDGWHHGHLVINGNKYCHDFLEGSLETRTIFIEDPVTSSPTPRPCSMQTVKLYTLFYAHEIGWDLLGVAGCSSAGQEYENYSVYEIECCIPDDNFTLKCMNSIGDGWHRGYLEIAGNKFCQDPFGFEETVDVSFPLGQPTGCKDSAPTHVCEKIMGGGWCEHVKSIEICSQTCNQCVM